MAQTLTHEMITAAIEGFESQKQRIDAQIRELRGMMSPGTHAPSTPSEERTKGGRRMSAAGRARIAEAQRKRWAAAKGLSSTTAAKADAPVKKKRRLSAAGRKAISDATKRRWALKRAEAAKAK